MKGPFKSGRQAREGVTKQGYSNNPPSPHHPAFPQPPKNVVEKRKCLKGSENRFFPSLSSFFFFFRLESRTKKDSPFHYFFREIYGKRRREKDALLDDDDEDLFLTWKEIKREKKLLVTHEHFSFCPFSSERHMGKGIYSTFEFRFSLFRSKD